MLNVGFKVAPSAQHLRVMLDALVRLNLLYMRRRKLPPLYKSGVKYRREPRGRSERWQTYPETLVLGFGDCEDLSCIRVAELRLQGVNAMPWLVQRGKTWHVVVKYPDGHIEDPSMILGMNRNKERG